MIISAGYKNCGVPEYLKMVIELQRLSISGERERSTELVSNVKAWEHQNCQFHRIRSLEPTHERDPGGDQR